MKPTREQIRHERACVYQQQASPTAAANAADIEANKRKAAELRRNVQKH